MVGHFQPEDLRGADQQDGFRARRVGRKALLEESGRADGASVPSRRSTVAVSRRISARSRSASPCSPGCARLARQLLVERDRRRRTPSRMSAAILRAARPGTSGCGEVRGRAMSRSLPRNVASARMVSENLRTTHSFVTGRPKLRSKPIRLKNSGPTAGCNAWLFIFSGSRECCRCGSLLRRARP